MLLWVVACTFYIPLPRHLRDQNSRNHKHASSCISKMINTEAVREYCRRIADDSLEELDYPLLKKSKGFVFTTMKKDVPSDTTVILGVLAAQRGGFEVPIVCGACH